MLTRVGKWGNSLGLRLPKSLAEELTICDGSAVDLVVTDGQLVVRPVEPRARYELSDLLEGVTEETLHGEVDAGPPRGGETW